jgi:hypothetical protein
MTVEVSPAASAGAMDLQRRDARQTKRLRTIMRLRAQNGRARVRTACSVTIGSTSQPIPSLTRADVEVVPDAPAVIDETFGLDLPFPGPSGSAQVACTGANVDGTLPAISVNADGTVPIASLLPVTVPCVPGPSVLCAEGNRFTITVSARNAAGQTVNGQVDPRDRYNDGGYFWFFNQSNVDVLIQVLNSCSRNERYWVFVSGLTSVTHEFNVSVTDSRTGVARTYFNPLGQQVRPLTDTDAFATCP